MVTTIMTVNTGNAAGYQSETVQLTSATVYINITSKSEIIRAVTSDTSILPLLLLFLVDYAFHTILHSGARCASRMLIIPFKRS